MQKCQSCSAERILTISGKTSDMCCLYVEHLNVDTHGYVPTFLGPNGWGDYIQLEICAECGQVQARNETKFPLTDDDIIEGINQM